MLLGAAAPAPLRLAALLVALDAAEPWTQAHHDAALGLLPAREFTVDRYSLLPIAGPDAVDPGRLGAVTLVFVDGMVPIRSRT
ncbi:hypothetical protein [Streptomyces sp. CB03911]|uniref:hypothetical protein n=1 Tax=Streptomycetaceae TaxID=2062 RepID=UPI00093FCB57|nr:hypothetical protein [Streptomyces sp. CB03911]OKI12684.1 hypothetical protein A6A07_17605 [Streptomyces sp. CB03911]